MIHEPVVKSDAPSNGFKKKIIALSITLKNGQVFFEGGGPTWQCSGAILGSSYVTHMSLLTVLGKPYGVLEVNLSQQFASKHPPFCITMLVPQIYRST